MKLKTLMANTLPRFRNHRQKVDNLHSLESYGNSDVIVENKFELADNLPRVYACENKLSCWQQLQPPSYTSSPPPSPQPHAVNVNLNAPQRDTLNVNLNAPHRDTLNVNLNALSTTEKCHTNKRISPCGSPDGTLIRTVSDVTRHKSSSDSDYNTVPRVRPRIRTNPWVSPRSTPTDSPVTVRSFCLSTQGKRRMSAGDRLPDRSGSPGERVPSEIAFNDDKFCDYRNCNNEDNPLSSCEDLNSTASAPVVFNPDMCISFEYEEMFESQIESAIGSSVEDEDYEVGDDDVFECCSPHSRDSSWGEYDTHLSETRTAVTSSTNSWDNLDGVWSDDQLVDDTDDTLCSDQSCSSEEAGTALENNDHFRDSSLENSSVECEQSTSQSEDDDLTPGIMECSFQSADSAMGSSVYTNDGFDGDTHDYDIAAIISTPTAPVQKVRSIEDVRLSLQEKVQRLQQQKYIVAEKVRAAQEEERVRAQEKLRFQRQMTLNRKQMLLQTLYILKSKLESQSQRLQATYDDVLQMQRTTVLDRRAPNAVCAVP